ncbi:hypothetical protein ACIBH1_30450 [Nonomuraea sp. NPDC050663]|uniref:hypothetical protein n=1 Tax=Nonomuraea sp. NPDC050663 TaxID=3364370 RepID=UPI0037AC0431
MINDEYLLAALRLGSGQDPIPPHVSAAAREAYSLRMAGAITASPVECVATRGVRDGSSGPRLVRFATAELAFDVEVTVGDGLIDLAGQVTPCPGEGSFIDIRTLQLIVRREVGRTGQFAATGLPPGWFSLVCHRPGCRPIVTRWLRIRS